MRNAVILASTFFVAFSGSLVTRTGMGWYRTLSLPWFTPSGRIIGRVWTTIFIFGAVSAIGWWGQKERDRRFWTVAGIFVANALLNVGWSVAFFGLHEMVVAIWIAAFLALSVWLLVALMWKRRLVSSILLVPYAAWATFATYLTYAVMRLQ
jgi:tryptophan-rich sensory protein